MSKSSALVDLIAQNEGHYFPYTLTVFIQEFQQFTSHFITNYRKISDIFSFDKNTSSLLN